MHTNQQMIWWNPISSKIGIGHELSVCLSVCIVHIFLLAGVFTPTVLLLDRNVWQQQRAEIIYFENVQLWHPFLAKGDTIVTLT
jgi:hypothetical protein